MAESEIGMRILFIKLPTGLYFLVIRGAHSTGQSLSQRLQALKSWPAGTNR